jgi:hypothetical protein
VLADGVNDSGGGEGGGRAREEVKMCQDYNGRITVLLYCSRPRQTRREFFVINMLTTYVSKCRAVHADRPAHLPDRRREVGPAGSVGY